MMNLFKEYLKQGQVKKKNPDTEEAKSHLEKANIRLQYFRKKKCTGKEASIVLENTYEGAREATQALMSLKGFKPYSHEATIHFLQEFYSKEFTEEELRKFDYFRQLRNDAVYRAEPVTIDDAENCKKFAESFLRKIKRLWKTEHEPV